MGLKRLTLTLILICLMSISVMAVEDSISPTDVGDPQHSFVLDNLDFFSRVQLGSPLTVVGNALCSTYPNDGNEYTPPLGVDRLCYTNKEHIGVAFQLFLVRNDGSYSYLGEKQILKDDKKCFSVSYGKNYHWDVYYCDEEQRTCSDFVSECHEVTREKRVRTCSDTGEEVVWVNHRVDLNAPFCSGFEPPETDEESMFIGTPTIFSNELKEGESVRIKQTFKAAKAGKYLLEAGIEKSGTLAAVTVSANVCNPNDKHYANKFVYLNKGEHTITFTVMPVEGEGRYVYHTAYVEDCGGKVIQQVNADDTVIVLAVEEEEEEEDDEEEEEEDKEFTPLFWISIGLASIGVIIAIAGLWQVGLIMFVIGLALYLLQHGGII